MPNVGNVYVILDAAVAPTVYLKCNNMRSAKHIRNATYTSHFHNYLRLLILVVISLLGTLWLAGEEVPTVMYIIGTIIICLSAVPLAVYFSTVEKNLFPLMEINCITYVFSFGISMFYFQPVQQAVTYSIDAKERAGYVCIVGLLSQISAYYLARNFLPHRLTKYSFTAKIENNRIRFLAWSLSFSSLIFYLFPEIRSVNTIGQFLALATTVSLSLLYTLVLQKKLTSIEVSIFFVFLLPLELFQRLATGAVAQLLILLLLMTIVRWIVLQKVAWSWILTAAVVYVLLNPVKFAYRDKYWTNIDADKNAQMLEKGEYFFQLSIDYWFLGKRIYSNDNNDRVFYRFDHMSELGVVVQMTPVPVPYWDGETIVLVAYSLIPRALWPDKPSMTPANEFGRRYGMLAQQDTTTTVNVTWIVELYMNYGYSGVVIGMFLIGIIFSVIERRLYGMSKLPLDYAISVSLTIGLVYPESNLAMLWGSVVIGIVVMYTLTGLLKS